MQTPQFKGKWISPDKYTKYVPPYVDVKVCRDPGHNAPSHLCVPNGQTREHRCPTCGETVKVS
jgi:hypothetical protein